MIESTVVARKRVRCQPGISCLSAVFAALSCAQLAYALPGTSNLAPAGTATATTAAFGSSIQDAIDGDSNGNFGAGSVYHSVGAGEESPLYYQVDLGVNAYIERVQLLRRSDSNDGIFGNLRLTVYQDDGAGNPGAVAFSQDYYTGGSFAYGTWGTTDPGASAPGGAFGRHVRFERLDNNYWITFAEFEVIGSTTPLNFTEVDNLAVGKSVSTLSGPGFGALLGSGNDGSIDGDFNRSSRPVYHSSNFGVGEYWQVDLGSTVALDHLELFTRSDGQTTSQFKVSVLDDSLLEVGAVIVDNSAPNAAVPSYDHTIDVSGLAGRYVRVETTQNEYLAFTELRAFAAVPEPAGFALGAASLLAVARRRRSC